MKRKRFAAFVMTYERPQIVRNTIEKLLQQTFSPEYILIVDNSSSLKTKELLEDLSDSRVKYYRMGYNSGPAGAARKGLQQLTSLGFEWIYWGDDDDPPGNNFIFEKFFQNIEELERSGAKLGIFGGKGALLNKKTGRVRSLANHELMRSRLQEVDVIPGGHTLLVNAEVVKKGILPTEELFFGFEELDFCLRVKEKGYKVVIDAASWLEVRIRARNGTANYQWRGSSFGKKEHLWKDYYSSRNLLVILSSQKLYRAVCFRLARMLLKSVVGFKFGWDYGIKNMKIQWRAVFHFLSGNFPANRFRELRDH